MKSANVTRVTSREKQQHTIMGNLEGIIQGVGVISGKCLPKENSVMTCEEGLMTVEHDMTYRTREMMIRTVVVDMEVATVAMADGSDVKIC